MHMSKYLDFAELKARTTYEQVVAKLGLNATRKGNQWRMECPKCKAGGPRSLVITEGKGFMCFAFHQGGDQIALVAHILDIAVKEAAEFLAGGTSTVPRNSTSNTVFPRAREVTKRRSSSLSTTFRTSMTPLSRSASA
jgi:DNA primase